MRKPTLLVVDDDLFFRRLYSELLREDGYQVEAVSSGEEALARLSEGGVDVVLTDMVMPGEDGLSVLRHAREMENPPEVVLVTGHATLESAIQALKDGARDYLVKPFNPEELRHLVRTCLEQRRLLDENTLLKSQIRLFQKGQSLSAILEIERLLSQAVTTLLHEIGAGRGFAFYFSDSQTPKVVGVTGVEDDEAAVMSRGLTSQLKSLTGLRLLRGDEVRGGPGWPVDLSTVAIFPLRYQKDVKGAIVISNPSGQEFPLSPPFDNLLFLAEQAALGFENACRYQDAQELIYTDDLTGLYNYRYLQMILDQEIRRTERYGLEFSLVFIDLDFFKEVNDRYGHLAGSQALRETAQRLKR
ncbi:MAG TPA: response regulator, partial [Desulfuromonadales bacterium]|nr:response regulator [Desulfuromonadales bacterium]